MRIIIFFNKPAAVEFFDGKPAVRARVDPNTHMLCLLPTNRTAGDDVSLIQKNLRGGIKVTLNLHDVDLHSRKVIIQTDRYGWLWVRPWDGPLSKNDAHGRIR